MNTQNALTGAVVTALTILAITAPHTASAQTIYRGLDINLPPTAIPMASIPYHDNARSNFLNDAPAWATAHNDNLNAMPTGAVPPFLNFGGGLIATVNIASFGTIRNTEFTGAHSINGGNYLKVEAAPNGTYLRLTFNRPILGIGFTHTDLMDQIETNLSGPTPLFRIIDDPSFTPAQMYLENPATVTTASVGYFGVHAENPFTTFALYRLSEGANTRDIVGLENFTVFVPSPGAITLLGIAGLAANRRRRPGH